MKLYSLSRKNKEISKTEEFKILNRMLKEQTKKGSIKPSKEISPDFLQNSTDPDATYRKKGKKKHIGYTGT